MSRLLNACFAVLNIATSVWFLQNCGFIYETNTAFIKTNAHSSSSITTNVYANNKIPSFHQS